MYTRFSDSGNKLHKLEIYKRGNIHGKLSVEAKQANRANYLWRGTFFANIERTGAEWQVQPMIPGEIWHVKFSLFMFHGTR